MKEDIVLIGGGGHAKVIIDIIRSTDHYNIIGICDNQEGEIEGVPIIGNDKILLELYDKGIRNAFVCIGALGNPKKRWDLYEYVKEIGYILPTLIHTTAYISPSVRIEEGTCVMPGAIINAGVSIGKMAIINTGSIIEHDCRIGDNSHISPGACLCGGVVVGENTHIGAKSVINQGITIGNYIIVGSGSVVVRDIQDSIIVAGNPAKFLKVYR